MRGTLGVDRQNVRLDTEQFLASNSSNSIIAARVRPKTKSLTPWKRFRYRLEVVAIKAAAVLVRRFSRKAVHRIGRALGWLAYYLSSERRRVALANLDIAFGDTKTSREKSRIARSSMQSAVATLICLLWSPRLTAENLQQWVEIDADSLARVREIQAQGTGIIFMTMHYGDWELLGLATGFYGIPMTVIQEAMPNEAMEKILGRLRAGSGHQFISQRFASIRLLKALKRGGSVAMLIDLNAMRRRGGVWIDFFGLPVFNNPTVAALAQRTGAAIILVVAHPLGDGRTKIVNGPQIKYTPTGDSDCDLRTISQECLKVCEQIIRDHPEHWLWAYKRWKFRPGPDLERYPYYSRCLEPKDRLPE